MRQKRFFSLLILFAVIFNLQNVSWAESAVELKSPSAILMEQNTGKILFEKNSNEVRYAASVMKVMNLLIAIEEIEAGRISEDDMVNISEDAAKVEGANVWLKSHESLSVRDLIKSIALVSANDAAVSLTEHISGTQGEFISEMNKRAAELGMQNTIFKDCIGSDNDGNVTSAHDTAIMAKELAKHQNITAYSSTWIDHIRNGQTQIVNTNKLIKLCQGVTGLKTGTSEKAGSCIAASANRNGVNLIAVVLGCENTQDRYKDAEKLLDHGFSEFITITPKLPENMPETIKVTNAMVNEVLIAAQINANLIIPKGSEGAISSELKLEESISAPTEINQKVGSIIYKLNNEVLYECDIIATTGADPIAFTAVFKEIIFKFLHL